MSVKAYSRVEAIIRDRPIALPKFGVNTMVRASGRSPIGKVQRCRRGFVPQAVLDSDDPGNGLIYEGGSYARDDYGFYTVRFGDTVAFYHEAELVAAYEKLSTNETPMIRA